MKPTLLKPLHWTDYELLDSGGYEKLERFGRYVVARPEPQAIWNKSLPGSEWKRRADAWFRKDARNEERGEWFRKPGMPDRWSVEYCSGAMKLSMRLGLTAFKHVGLFPEQAENWDFIYNEVRKIARATDGSNDRKKDDGQATGAESKGAGGPDNGVRVLNLFAYTGGASLAARSAGADVTHVDSVKQVVSWSRENMEASRLDGIRWVVEDALKFVWREVKRGKKYHGIILDPPAYGRGADGERWILEENINEMLTLCGSLLEERGFIVLNLYSMGLSALLARGAVRQLVGAMTEEQFGELYVEDPFGKALPLGVYYRGSR